MYVTVTADVDVDAEDFSTQDLIRELKSRGVKQVEVLTLKDAVHTLEVAGCPKELVEPIKDWARQPLLDAMMLKHWYEMCGVPFPQPVVVG